MENLNEIYEMNEIEFNGVYVIEKNGVITGENEYSEPVELPTEITNALDDIAYLTKQNGDDITAFQSDAEQYLKKMGYSVRRLDKNWDYIGF